MPATTEQSHPAAAPSARGFAALSALRDARAERDAADRNASVLGRRVRRAIEADLPASDPRWFSNLEREAAAADQLDLTLPRAIERDIAPRALSAFLGIGPLLYVPRRDRRFEVENVCPWLCEIPALGPILDNATLYRLAGGWGPASWANSVLLVQPAADTGLPRCEQAINANPAAPFLVRQLPGAIAWHLPNSPGRLDAALFYGRQTVL